MMIRYELKKVFARTGSKIALLLLAIVWCIACRFATDVYWVETLKTPFNYDYTKGWGQLFEYMPTIIMIAMLILGYLVAGIFSNEFSWKADAIFFSAVHGRGRAVAAKLEAGFLIVTALYWTAVLSFSAAVLGYLGVSGWNCPVQADSNSWKCFYNIQVWQEYLLVIGGGYIGCLLIGFMTMYVSARFKSAVLGVMTPFVWIFLPSFLGNLNSAAANKVLGLLPDRLLQIHAALSSFDLYEPGGKVVGAVPILFVVYSVLTVVLPPLLYEEYRRKQAG